MERVRSPLVTAVATSAMARTCVVRLAASWLTLSVSARQVPAAPARCLAAQLAFHADLAGHAGDLVREVARVSIMPLMVSARAPISP